jgi:hypothetical protein
MSDADNIPNRPPAGDPSWPSPGDETSSKNEPSSDNLSDQASISADQNQPASSSNDPSSSILPSPDAPPPLPVSAIDPLAGAPGVGAPGADKLEAIATIATDDAQSLPSPITRRAIPPRVDPNEITTYSLLRIARSCRRCQYSLLGLPLDSFCPECGLPIIESLSPEEIDPEALVTFKRQCRVCNYELVGLRLRAKCPECGTLVRDSIRVDELRNSPLPYLITLRRGFGLAALSIALGIIGYVIAFGSGLALAGTGVSSQFVHAIWQIIAGGVAFAAWWIASTPDSSCPADRDIPLTRRWLRISLIIVVVIAIGSAIVQGIIATGSQAAINAGLVPTQGPGMALFYALAGLASFASLGAHALWFVCTMLYIRWIADRIPDPTIAKEAMIYIWLLPVLYVVFFLCLCIGPVISYILFAVLVLRLWGRIAAFANAAAASLQPPPPATIEPPATPNP